MTKKPYKAPAGKAPEKEPEPIKTVPRGKMDKPALRDLHTNPVEKKKKKRGKA